MKILCGVWQRGILTPEEVSSRRWSKKCKVQLIEADCFTGEPKTTEEVMKLLLMKEETELEIMGWKWTPRIYREFSIGFGEVELCFWVTHEVFFGRLTLSEAKEKKTEVEGLLAKGIV